MDPIGRIEPRLPEPPPVERIHREERERPREREERDEDRREREAEPEEHPQRETPGEGHVDVRV